MEDDRLAQARMDLLTRVDERTTAIQNDIKNLRTDITSTVTSLSKAINDVEDHFNREMEKMQASFDKKFVTQDSFWPVKAIVYGIVSTILMSVMGAILALVIVKNAAKAEPAEHVALYQIERTISSFS